MFLALCNTKAPMDNKKNITTNLLYKDEFAMI